MGALKDAIGYVINTAPLPVVFLDSIATEQASRRIAFNGRQEGFRPDHDYNRIATQLKAKLIYDEPLRRRELSDSIWCLWATDPALAEDERHLKRILRQIESEQRPRFFRALAASFLRSFDNKLPGGKQAAFMLLKISSLAKAPYDKLQSEFSIFDLKEGPGNLAREMLRQKVSVQTIFADHGLGEMISKGGYAAHCALQALRRIESQVEMEAIERLQLVKNISMDSLGKLLFEGQKPAMANALLIPYASKNPEKPDRDQILKFLVETIGDPRLHSARWTSMPEAETIALRWLTEQSLRQFLDIVDRVADPQMWRYRRRFWEAVHNYGMIDSAWVIFDIHGKREAWRSFGTQAKFGFIRNGIQKGQAVLLLRIGNSVIAEWSHNGRCHIWADASEGPQLYRNYYDPKSLHATPIGNYDGPDRFSQIHSSAKSYGWQAKVAKRIYSITGKRLRLADYKVDR